MSNMGYCRFQNTLKALQDCLDHMEDILGPGEEMQAQQALIALCREVHLAYRHWLVRLEAATGD